MNLFFILFYICFKIYNNQLCEEINSCYYCTISNNNCFWFNNSSCYSQNSKELNNNFNNNNIINSFLSKPFITYQYNCITNKNDIESFKELNNYTITLSITPNILKLFETIKYHIYCFVYETISNIILSLHYNKTSINNILQLSIFDNLTNKDILITLGKNNDKINIHSNSFCIKITYSVNNSLQDIISFHIDKYSEYNFMKNKSENILSYIILISIILIIIIIIWIFIICHKNKSGIMKEITIINKVNIYHQQRNETNENEERENNFDKSNCSELQGKYIQLEKKRFVAHNYETLNSFVKNIHDIEKKNLYLKAIIKTIPTFLIGINNTDFIGSICSFCENKIKFNDNVCLLNCGHIFHYDCIYQQIITNEEYNCIICKENIII